MKKLGENSKIQKFSGLAKKNKNAFATRVICGAKKIGNQLKALASWQTNTSLRKKTSHELEKNSAEY